MSEELKLSIKLKAAINAGDGTEIAKTGAEIDDYIFNCAFVSSSLFDDLIAMLKSDKFRRLSESIGGIKLFEYNIQFLSDDQKWQLQSVLTESVSELEDSVSAFLAVELIAEIWADSRSLEALLQLGKAASEHTLALAVHGFDWLAKKTDKIDIKDKCLEELRCLSKNPSNLVRSEAIVALRRREGAAR